MNNEIKRLMEIAGVAHLPKAKALYEGIPRHLRYPQFLRHKFNPSLLDNTKEAFDVARRDFIADGASPSEVDRLIDQFKQLVEQGEIVGKYASIAYYLNLARVRFKRFKEIVVNPNERQRRAPPVDDVKAQRDYPDEYQGGDGKVISGGGHNMVYAVIPMNFQEARYRGIGTKWPIAINADLFNKLMLEDYVFFYIETPVPNESDKQRWLMQVNAQDPNFIKIFDINNNEVSIDEFNKRANLTYDKVDPIRYRKIIDSSSMMIRLRNVKQRIKAKLEQEPAK